MKKLICIYFLFVPTLIAAQEKLKVNNNWVETLGRYQNYSGVVKWAKEQGGIYMANPEKTRFVYVFPKYGMALDYSWNTVNQSTTLKRVVWGTASEVRRYFPKLKEEASLKSSGNTVFGFRIGTSRGEIEKRVGSALPSYNMKTLEGGQGVTFVNPPQLIHLTLGLVFVDDKLASVMITTDKAYDYQNKIKKVSNLNLISYPDLLKKDLLITSKFHYGKLKSTVNAIFHKEGLENPDFILSSMKRISAADYVEFKDGRFTAVFCTSMTEDKKSVFNKMLINMESIVSQRYLADSTRIYYRTKERSGTELLYIASQDTEHYERTNERVLFHTYWLKEANEVVLSAYLPGAWEGDSGRLGREFYNGCSFDSQPEIKSDIEILSKVDELRQKYAHHPGNSWFKYIGSQDRKNARGVLPLTQESKAENLFYMTQMTFLLDAKDRSFEGDVPFGLKKNMKMSDVRKVIPSFSFSDKDKKYKERNMYVNLPFYENVKLVLALKFVKNKLKSVVIWATPQRAREWLLLKDPVFGSL